MIPLEQSAEVLDYNTSKEDFEDEYEYILVYFDKIKNVDIKEFDYDTFRDYIAELTNKEFTKLWDKSIEELLSHINENYLDVEIDKYSSIDDVRIKRNVFLKITQFIMDSLPYDFFVKVFPSSIVTINEATAFIDSNLEDIVDNIIDEIRSKQNVTKKIINIIDNVVDVAKKKSTKEMYKDRVNYVVKNVKTLAKYDQYFISLITNTQKEHLKRLFKKYAEYFIA